MIDTTGETQSREPAAIPSPIRQSQRIESIDVLRGFALLGILILNIQCFAMITAAYLNPTAYGDLTGANYQVWFFSHLLADQKFMSIFSMLFGAGLLVMTQRSEVRTGKSAGVHYRRMGWLLLFGLLHAHLLWYGDILFCYGLAGLFVFLVRRLSPTLLIVIAVPLMAISSALMVLSGFSMPFWGEAEVEAFKYDSWLPTAEAIEWELEAYRGTWLDQARHRSVAALGFQFMIFPFFVMWRVLGLMMIGMALLKLRYLDASRPAGIYLLASCVFVAIGLPIVWLGISQNEAHDWDVQYSFFFGSQFNYWGSILVSMGYVSLVMLVCTLLRNRLILRPLAAVGQMALTNYLMQTIICTTIFYGHGFGYFGSFSRVEQIQTVALVWVAQLVYSPIWLHYFRFGPFEWLWRSLTYKRWQPLVRAT